MSRMRPVCQPWPSPHAPTTVKQEGSTVSNSIQPLPPEYQLGSRTWLEAETPGQKRCSAFMEFTEESRRIHQSVGTLLPRVKSFGRPNPHA
uniref:Uncharacterized protein n=1 Tax=Gorilla gorilla gorilla TaxID=9595 RepID=A0A2I2YZA0_GORGO